MENIIFTPLQNREPISKIISDQIEEAIFKKELSPGDKIPSEIELCRQFGVSRTSVRAAIQTLVAQGFVNVIKGKGIFVNDISMESVTNPLQKYLKFKLKRDYVMDIVHARQIIEPAIVEFAARHHTDEDIIKLRADVEALKNCKGGYLELANLDMNFHVDLAISSSNNIMPLILRPLHKLIPEVKSFVYATVQDAKESAVIWHTKILDAVINSDAEGARRAMEQHLRIAEQHSEMMLASKP